MVEPASRSLDLIGGSAIVPGGETGTELVNLYRRLFLRVPAVVELSAERSRWIGWREPLDASTERRFLALEAPPQQLPDDLQAFTLSDWSWWHAGTRIGDPADAWLTALQPMAMDSRPEDVVDLHPYDPAWPQRAAALASWLRERFGEAIGAIEHYGSTAVPGLLAKPVLDLLIEVETFEAVRPLLLPALSGDCWEYWWYDERMLFVQRERPFGKRLAHLHVAPRSHPIWEGLRFRDLLRREAAVAAAYAELKQELATAHHHDREAYTKAKSAFIRRQLP